MPDFSIRTDYLMAAAQYISNDETRYYLEGVLVTPHEIEQPGRGVLMVATDGACMAVVYDAYGHAPRPAILSADFKHRDLKKPAREVGTRRLVFPDTPALLSGAPAPVVPMCQEDDVRVSTTEKPAGYVTLTEIDGTFPDFWRVIPITTGEGPGKPYSWNVAHFARLTKAARLLGQPQALATFHQASPSDPALIRLKDCPQAVFIHMPLHVAPEGPLDWLAEPKAE